MKKIEFTFQKTYPFEKRNAEAERIKAKYPERIPIVCQLFLSDKTEIDKSKYLVPKDVTIGQFLYIIRKRVRLSPDKGLFIFTENQTLPPTSAHVGLIYKEHVNKDGFLYLCIRDESKFG